MKNAVIYVHGKRGDAAEAEHYVQFFPDADVIGFDYKSQTPWDAKVEFSAFFDDVQKTHNQVLVIGNSIGSYFTMSSLADKPVAHAFLISPVVDMERLILNMMQVAGVSEDELRVKKIIKTPVVGELSWDYLCYVREHPIQWPVPTDIIYADQDNFTSLDTMTAFAEHIGASLTVMKNGEHWFHTEEQMAFLDAWFKKIVGC